MVLFGSIASMDLVWNLADVFMGLTSQLSYKNWDLSFALRASIGNYAYNNVQSNREAWDGSQMYDQTGKQISRQGNIVLVTMFRMLLLYGWTIFH